MSRFGDALEFVLTWEGGFVKDPDDRGGATNRGITQETYDKWRAGEALPLRSVRHLAQSELEAIYQSMYWDAAHCGAMEWPLAVVHFDLAVNGGVLRAAKMLQQALGVAADGKIGPVTLAAIARSDQAVVARKYVDLRDEWYRRIAVGNQRKFLRGWLNRTYALRVRLRKGPSPTASLAAR